MINFDPKRVNFKPGVYPALIWMILSLAISAFGQSSELNKLRAKYDQQYGTHLLLKSGKEYGYFYNNASGIHVIGDSSGKLYYHKIKYEAIELYYDLYNDLLLVRNEQAGSKRFVIINQAYIDEFWLEERHFIHFRQAPDSIMGKGLFELAYEKGSIRLLVKRRMTLDKNTSRLPEEVKSAKFVRNDIHYLQTDLGTYKIRNKKDLLSALEYKEAVEAFIKTQKIRFSPRKEAFTQQIIRVLDRD